MIKVRDFKCSNGHYFEEFVADGTATSRCGCGANATIVPSATKTYLDGSSGDFPGAHMRWIRDHERGGRQQIEEA